MRFGVYGILVVLGLFVLLLIFNPQLSCFGKRVRSPLYPLWRKRKKKAVRAAHDYGFHLIEGKSAEKRKEPAGPKKPDRKTEDYGFRLD
ncbi:MAG: hypothetical protein FJY81_04125 [Candidatus Aminicenantes bacterium]|nr:hypothetical protein [Candidatus Aminicenantes bacterium]